MSQTIYPHTAKLFSESISEGITFLKQIFKYTGTAVFIICLILFIFSEEIITILAGTEYQPSVIVLRIISFLPFIIFLSNLAGIQTMLNLNYKREYTIIIVSAAFISITLSLIFVPIYKEIGTSFSALITEVFVTAAMIIFILKKLKYKSGYPKDE